MERTITRVQFPARLAQKKKVAAYARVSTGKDAMLHSLAAQVDYYSDLIRRTNGWEYIGVYTEMLTPSLIQMHPTRTQIAP